MKKINYLLGLLGLLPLIACSPKPQPIEYGLDQCHFCKMNIVEDQFAAEWVTDKGKVYKFDAIECMARHLTTQQQASAFELVCNYLQPGQWINAGESTFLISPEIPSPMGGYLSAFQSDSEARTMLERYGGDIYNWSQIQDRFDDVNFSAR